MGQLKTRFADDDDEAKIARFVQKIAAAVVVVVVEAKVEVEVATKDGAKRSLKKPEEEEAKRSQKKLL